MRNKRMKFWPKLIALLILIALLAFVGARLVGVIANLLGGIRETGTSGEQDPQFQQVEPTQTPLVFTDQDYDKVQGVAEY